MIASILFASAALSAPVNASAVSSSAADAPRRTTVRPTDEPTDEALIGLLGEPIGSSADFDTAVGGSFSNPFMPSSIRPLGGGIYQFLLTDTGTGWNEMFLLAVPHLPPTEPQPLLVAFHGYSSTPNSILHQTRYLQKAQARGWYAMAPMGAHKYNHGVDYAMDNIEAAITWVFDNNLIDPDRMYGVGFSMGGGVAAAYAARHQDPTKPRFAAIVNHTGTVSMRDLFNNVTNSTLLEDPEMFGGTPDEFPFAYAKASAIDYDMFEDLTDPETDLARNLKHTPVYQWAVAGDPLPHLVNQAGLLHDQIETRGGTSSLNIGTGSVHEWDSLNEGAVLNFLEPMVRQDPPVGPKLKTLVHADGRFYHFDVDQAQAGTFSSFEWKVLTGLNRIYFEKVKNVSQFTFSPEDASLQCDQPVEIVLQALDSGPVQVELNGFTAPPTNVTRDSVATVDWTWDATHSCILITENDPSTYRLWTIEP